MAATAWLVPTSGSDWVAPVEDKIYKYHAKPVVIVVVVVVVVVVVGYVIHIYIILILLNSLSDIYICQKQITCP